MVQIIQARAPFRQGTYNKEQLTAYALPKPRCMQGNKKYACLNLVTLSVEMFFEYIHTTILPRTKVYNAKNPVLE